jgi:hypothetical protein
LFSSFISLLNNAPFILNKFIKSILISFLEISQGIKASFGFENKYICSFLLGFSLGFSGLCVIFQIFSVCDNRPLNKIKFVALKILQGALLGVVTTIYAHFFEIESTISVSYTKGNLTFISTLSLIVVIYFLIFKIKSEIFKFLC